MFTRFECRFIFTRFVCSFILTRFECRTLSRLESDKLTVLKEVDILKSNSDKMKSEIEEELNSLMDTRNRQIDQLK